MIAKEYKFLTQEELELYGLTNSKYISVEDLPEECHVYGEDILSDIDYDLAQERLLKAKLKKK